MQRLIDPLPQMEPVQDKARLSHRWKAPSLSAVARVRMLIAAKSVNKGVYGTGTHAHCCKKRQ